MTKPNKSSLDFRHQLHARLNSKDSSGVRRLLTRWCTTAPGTNARLPGFLMLPLQPRGDSIELCQETIQPTAFARVQLLLELANEFDLLCYLAEVEPGISLTTPASKPEDDAKSAKLLRIESLNGSAAEYAINKAALADEFFVPPDVYASRAAATPNGQHDKRTVNEVAFLIMPRRLRFDFVLEIGGKSDRLAFMLCKLSEAKKSPNDAIHRQYVSRILELILIADPSRWSSKPPTRPFISCVQPAVKTCLANGWTEELLAQLSLRPRLSTAVLIHATKAMRDMFNDVPFAVLEPCMDAAMKAYYNVSPRWSDVLRFRKMAEALGDARYLAWCTKQVDGMLCVSALGDRPSTIICLIEMTIFHKDPIWFTEKMMPLLRQCVGDIVLTVSVLHGLVEASNKGSFERIVTVAAVLELSPKLMASLRYMDVDTLAQFHSMLLGLEMLEESKEMLEKIAAYERSWPKDESWPSGSLSRTIPGLRSMLKAMQTKNIPPATGHYQQFAINRLERYLWYQVRSEPSTSMSRFKAGCMQCIPCGNLDDFLLSPATSMSFNLELADAKHLTEQLRKLPDHASQYQHDSWSSNPSRSLTITKRAKDHTQWHDAWRRRIIQAKTDIALLGSDEFLRSLLGERYRLIANLDGLRLVRDADGEEIGTSVFSREYQMRQAQSTRPIANSLSLDTPAVISLKRKPGAGLDQENISPPAKRGMGIAIDICSDSDDD